MLGGRPFAEQEEFASTARQERRRVTSHLAYPSQQGHGLRDLSRRSQFCRPSEGGADQPLPMLCCRVVLAKLLRQFTRLLKGPTRQRLRGPLPLHSNTA